MTKNNEHPLALPVGTELVGDYIITKVLGTGGFGITYEAKERSLDRTVAIKEYFPVDIVEREGWALVKARSNTLDMKYARGLRRFIEEAKAITQFNHPNIVRVLRYFKTNNTAFMVLHYEEGVDMGVWREEMVRPPSEHQLTAIISPLLDALKLIHDNDFLHRDIAPDNIIIRKDGSPILIDFGSARSDLTFNSKTVSALVKSGYSPFEQYAKNSKEQGPWTDIYSFGATLYQMVTGEAPPDSLSRLAVDEIIPAKKRSKKYYSRDFLAAIDSALEIKIADRPQSIEDWRSLLFPNNAADTASGSNALHAKGLSKGGSGALKTRSGGLLKNTGQSSVADLIAKAGLKPANLGENAAKLASFVKAPLLKLVPQGGDKTQPKTLEPSPLPLTDLDEEPAEETLVPSPRSLKSLLDELDHRYEGGGHENAIEKAANPGSVKAQETFSEPEETPSSSLPQKGKALVLSAKRQLKKVHLPSQLIDKLPQKLPHGIARLWPDRLPKRLIAGIAFLGLTIGGISYFRSDLGKVASNVELPQIIKNPGDLFAHADEALVTTLNAHDGGVDILRLANKGQHLVSSGADKVIKVWSMVDGALIRQYTAHDTTITAVDVKGQRLAQGDSNGNISLFDLEKNLQISTFQAAQGPIRSMAFSGQGNDLVTGADNGQLDYWEFKNDQYTLRKLRGKEHGDTVTAIISHKRFFVTGSADNSAKIWRRSRKNLIRSYQGHSGQVSALAISPKAYRLATGSLDDSIKIWSPKARRLRRTIPASQGGVLALGFAKNGKWLASGGKDHSIKIWNARNGRFVRALKGHSAAVTAVLFSPDGKRLISAGADETIRFWDWNTRKKK